MSYCFLWISILGGAWRDSEKLQVSNLAPAGGLGLSRGSTNAWDICVGPAMLPTAFGLTSGCGKKKIKKKLRLVSKEPKKIHTEF
jgi:hypothetical protein